MIIWILNSENSTDEKPTSITNPIVTRCFRYSPIGIMFLVMAEYSVSDISEYATQIGLYMLTVIVGLAIHFFVVLPLILLLVAKRNPLRYYKSLLPAMATAFGRFPPSGILNISCWFFWRLFPSGSGNFNQILLMRVFYFCELPTRILSGTASSTVTIPLTMKCTKKAGVSDNVVDFVIPVGATVNMDGQCFCSP